MSEPCRHRIIERPLDRALWLVIEAFVREGFLLKALDVSRRPQRTTGRDSGRYFLMKATYPDVKTKRLRLDRDIAVLIAFDELTAGETRVTITRVTGWREAHPALAAVADALDGHVKDVLEALSSRGLQPIAA
jgi:hypothetical protein